MNHKIVFLFFIVGCILSYIGYREYLVSQGAKPDPETIDLAKIEEGRTGLKNNYVRIGRHWRGWPHTIFAYKSIGHYYTKEADQKKSAIYALHPVISENHPHAASIRKDRGGRHGSGEAPGSAPAAILSFAILIKTEKHLKAGEIPSRWELREETEGLIVNRIKKLSLEESHLIKSQFPHIDPDNLLILEENRRPLSRFAVFTIIGVGAAMILIGFGVLLFGRKSLKSA